MASLQMEHSVKAMGGTLLGVPTGPAGAKEMTQSGMKMHSGTILPGLGLGIIDPG